MSKEKIEILKRRCSRRSFLNTPIEEIEKVREIVKEIDAKDNISFELVEDNGAIFYSLKLVYGWFRNVTNIVMLRMEYGDSHGKEKIGYYGQEMILRFTELNLATCWVCIDFDKVKTKYNTDTHELIAVIIVGNAPDELTASEKSIFDLMHQNRAELSDCLVTNSAPPEWVMNGLSTVMLAPSTINKMKPTFYFDNGEVAVAVPNTFSYDFVDLGIFKYHFELGAGGKFPFGNNSIFEKT